MLAALTLMIICLYFWQRKKPILPLIIPMLFIIIITFSSIIIKIQLFYNQNNFILLTISCLMLILILWMEAEGILVVYKKIIS